MNIAYKKRMRADYIFAITVFLLILFGVVMIYSVSSVISFERYGNNFYYAIKQIISFTIGVGALIVTYLIDYRFWKKSAFWLFLITIILMLLVFLPVIGRPIGGAQRWIGVGNFLFQPSEVLKLTFVLYLA